MEIDNVKPTDELYQKIISLVEYLAECIITHDLEMILLSWIRFRIDKSSSPVMRLREIFEVMLHNDMVIEISNQHLILFKDAPGNTHIPLAVLSEETKTCLKMMLSQPLVFFDDVEIVAIQYSTYSKFKYMSTFKKTSLWNKFITHYIETLLSPSINKIYLKNRGIEILVCFITAEVAHANEDYIKKASHIGSEWREKNNRYILNLELLYNELNKKLFE
jgi:hypothetical protein